MCIAANSLQQKDENIIDLTGYNAITSDRKPLFLSDSFDDDYGDGVGSDIGSRINSASDVIDRRRRWWWYEKKRNNHVVRDLVFISLGLIDLLMCYVSIHNKNVSYLSILFGPIILLIKVIYLTQAWMDSFQISTSHHKQKLKADTRKARKITVRSGKKKEWNESAKYHANFIFYIIFIGRILTMPLFHPGNIVHCTSSKILVPLKFQTGDHALFSVIELILIFLHHMASNYLQKMVKTILIQCSKKIVSNAIFHPFQYQFRLQQVLILSRWIVFLTPLIGICNKLRGHVIDGLKSCSLYRRKRHALEAWDKVVQYMTKMNHLDLAVYQVQFGFRRMKEQKAMRRMRYIELTRSRSRIATEVFEKIEKKWKLDAETTKENREKTEILLTSKVKKTLCNNDSQIRKKKQKIRQFLIKPNSEFVLIWRVLTILCVALELYKKMNNSTESHQPYLSFMRPTTDQISSLIYPYLAPNELVANSFLFQNTSTSIQKLAGVMNQILMSSTPLVNCITFIDVFVNFFTGSSQHGRIAPKRFMRRWIFPGIAFQLLVNPTMSSLLKYLKSYLCFALKVGPTRVGFDIFLIFPILKLTQNFIHRKSLKKN